MIPKAPILENVHDFEGTPYGEAVRDYYHIHYSKIIEQARIDERAKILAVVDDYYDLFMDELQKKYMLSSNGINVLDAKILIRTMLENSDKYLE